ASLEEALDALEADSAFLKAGGVFTDDLIETWVSDKRDAEVEQVRAAPPPLGVPPLLRHLGQAPTTFRQIVVSVPTICRRFRPRTAGQPAVLGLWRSGSRSSRQ